MTVFRVVLLLMVCFICVYEIVTLVKALCERKKNKCKVESIDTSMEKK